MVEQTEEGKQQVHKLPVQSPLIGVVLPGEAPPGQIHVILEGVVQHVPGTLPDLGVEHLLAEGATDLLQYRELHPFWVLGQRFLDQGNKSSGGEGRRLVVGHQLLDPFCQFTHFGGQLVI